MCMENNEEKNDEKPVMKKKGRRSRRGRQKRAVHYANEIVNILCDEANGEKETKKEPEKEKTLDVSVKFVVKDELKRILERPEQSLTRIVDTPVVGPDDIVEVPIGEFMQQLTSIVAEKKGWTEEEELNVLG